MAKHGITSALSLSATGLRIAGVAGFLLLSAAAVTASDFPSRTVPPDVSKPATAATFDVEMQSADPKAPILPAIGPEAGPVEKPVEKSVEKNVDKAKAPKPAQAALGEAFIAQGAVRVYLGRPLTISLHNARGQLLYQLESSRPMETLPLNSVNTGSLYLTLRAGKLEMTKKLVYSGK